MILSLCPVISVVMTCRSYDPYFIQSLESIVFQTYDNFEVVIVVESEFIIFEKIINSKFPDYLNKIKLFESRISGFCFCINYGIHKSSGRYIARMDSDDISSRDRFDLQINFLENNPSYSVVGSRAAAIDSMGNIIPDLDLKYFKSNSEIKSVLPYRNPLYHSSLMIRRELFSKKGGYKYDFFAQDHEMWIRWSFDDSIKFFNIDKILYFYRRYDAQETSINNANRAYYEISSFLYKFFLQTKNPKFLFGILIVHPFSRWSLFFMRKFIKLLFRE